MRKFKSEGSQRIPGRGLVHTVKLPPPASGRYLSENDLPDVGEHVQIDEDRFCVMGVEAMRGAFGLKETIGIQVGRSQGPSENVPEDPEDPEDEWDGPLY